MDSKVKKKLAAEYLASGCGIKEAAEKAGVHFNSIRNWLEDKEFAALVEEKQNNYVEAVHTEVIASWSTLVNKAYSALHECLQPDKPDNIRLKAAIEVLRRDDEQSKNESSTTQVIFENMPVLGAPDEEAIVDGQNNN